MLFNEFILGVLSSVINFAIMIGQIDIHVYCIFQKLYDNAQLNNTVLLSLLYCECHQLKLIMKCK